MCDCKQKEMDDYIERRWPKVRVPPNPYGDSKPMREPQQIVHNPLLDGTAPQTDSFMVDDCASDVWGDDNYVRVGVPEGIVSGVTSDSCPVLCASELMEREIEMWNELYDYIRPTHKPFKLWGWVKKVLTW